jgi:hypothetical protein
MDVKINRAGAADEETAINAPAPLDPNAPAILTDTKGRTITVQRPELLAEFDFIEAIGPKLSANHTWVQMAMQCIYVREIDGLRVSKPSTEAAVKALVVRLGHEGFEAIGKWVVDRAEAMQAVGGDVDEDKVKNS